MSDIKIKHPTTIFGYKVWFISDLHFAHKNIAKYAKKRAEVGGFDSEDIDAHDRWLINRWNETVHKKDCVYILGDLTFLKPSEAIKLVSKLNGRKWWFLGNHDRISDELLHYFEVVDKQSLLLFKQHNFDFLEEDFRVFVNHFPVEIWDKKQYGACHAHGHMHGSIDEYNKSIPDLRVDVGLDSELADLNLISLEKLYRHFKQKSGGKLFQDYIRDNKKILI